MWSEVVWYVIVCLLSLDMVSSSVVSVRSCAVVICNCVVVDTRCGQKLCGCRDSHVSPRHFCPVSVSILATVPFWNLNIDTQSCYWRSASGGLLKTLYLEIGGHDF